MRKPRKRAFLLIKRMRQVYSFHFIAQSAQILSQSKKDTRNLKMDTSGKKEVKEFLLRERRPDPIPKRPRRNEGEKRQSSQQAKHSFSCIASRSGGKRSHCTNRSQSSCRFWWDNEGTAVEKNSIISSYATRWTVAKCAVSHLVGVTSAGLLAAGSHIPGYERED